MDTREARKLWLSIRWLVLGAGFVVATELLLVAVLVGTWIDEERRVPDLDAMPELEAPPAPVPPDAEAWQVLESAMQDHEKENDPALKAISAAGYTIDDRSTAAALCADGQSAIAGIESALARPGMTVPRLPDTEQEIADFPPVLELQYTGKEAAVCAMVEPDPTRAAELAVLPFRLGARIADSDLDMFALLIAVGLENQGLSALERLLEGSFHDSEAGLARAAALLRDAGHDAQGFPRAYLHIAKDHEEALQRISDSPSFRAELGLRSPLLPLVYYPKVTRAWIRAYDLAILDQAQRPAWQRVRIEPQPRFIRGRLIRNLVFNPIGRRLHDELTYIHWADADREDCAQARRRGLMVVLAARRYALVNGALPERAEQLVPTYLDALPADPFADAPIGIVDGIVRSAGDGHTISKQEFPLHWDVRPAAAASSEP